MSHNDRVKELIESARSSYGKTHWVKILSLVPGSGGYKPDTSPFSEDSSIAKKNKNIHVNEVSDNVLGSWWALEVGRGRS